MGELFLKENGFQIYEEDYNIELKKIVQDIKASSLNSGLSLSDLPPLFIEDDECLHKENLYLYPPLPTNCNIFFLLR